MGEQAHADAILARLNAALAPVMAYDIHDIPASRPKEYVAVHLARRFGGPSRADSRKNVEGWRLTIRGVSRTSVDNVRQSLDTCQGVIEYRPLDVNGERSTLPQFETASPIGEDDGWFVGARAYTYAL